MNGAAIVTSVDSHAYGTQTVVNYAAIHTATRKQLVFKTGLSSGLRPASGNVAAVKQLTHYPRSGCGADSHGITRTLHPADTTLGSLLQEQLMMRM